MTERQRRIIQQTRIRRGRINRNRSVEILQDNVSWNIRRLYVSYTQNELSRDSSVRIVNKHSTLNVIGCEDKIVPTENWREAGIGWDMQDGDQI